MHLFITSVPCRLDWTQRCTAAAKAGFWPNFFVAKVKKKILGTNGKNFLMNKQKMTFRKHFDWQQHLELKNKALQPISGKWWKEYFNVLKEFTISVKFTLINVFSSSTRRILVVVVLTFIWRNRFSNLNIIHKLWTNILHHNRIKRRRIRIEVIAWSLLEQDFDFHTLNGRKLFTEIMKLILRYQTFENR